ILLAAAYMAFPVLFEKDRAARARLSRILGGVGVVGLAVAGAGWWVWERALPESVQRLFLGEKPLLASLATGRSHTFRVFLVAAFLALLVVLLPKLQSWPVAILALLAGAGILAGYERVREGIRKPFVIAEQMFSNGILVSEIDRLNEKGILSKAAWANKEAGGRAVSTGEAVFRAQCASCHTRDGYLGIRKIASAMDAEFAEMFLGALRDDGANWKARAAGEDVKPDYPFMPPFVGTDEEIRALAHWLASLNAPQVAEVTHAR
ncbi:MAG: c-type cytochrome, partial [Thermoanaerobaculia bacterium]|nr:c-type cytochrome [Thermoanaerobaculia bacterium]